PRFRCRCLQKVQQGDGGWQRQGTQQPEEHQTPEQIGKELRSAAEQQPGRQYQDDRHAGCNGHIDYGPKYGLQHGSHLPWSMIRRIDSSSAADSIFRDGDAVRISGREPPECSATKDSLCLAKSASRLRWTVTSPPVF